MHTFHQRTFPYFFLIASLIALSLIGCFSQQCAVPNSPAPSYSCSKEMADKGLCEEKVAKQGEEEDLRASCSYKELDKLSPDKLSPSK